MTDKSIHVLLAFDDNFWAPAYAAMRGMCLATRRRADLVFHLFQLGLTKEHRVDLERITEEFGAELDIHDLATEPAFREEIAHLPRDSRLNHLMYARLLVAALLPKTIDRVIYMDCDTYVRGDIAELAEIDLAGHPIGAVEEPHADLITTKRDMLVNRDLFDPADAYFNSGLLVIDMKKWRAAKVLDKLKTMSEDGTMARIYYDQDFLNLIFKHDWQKLDPAWNLIDPRRVHQSFNPKMLHYTGSRRPWKLWSGTAFARVYRHVMTNELFYRYMRHRWKTRLKKLFRLS